MAGKNARTVVITGASEGIGRETAFRFAREKWNVVLTYHKDEEEGNDARSKCDELGARSSLLLQLDVSDPHSVKRAVNEIARNMGKVSVLVNNAGIDIWKPLREQTPEEVSRQMRTNLEGLIIMTLEMLPHVEDMIINLGSRTGIEGYPGITVYGATKAGIRGFTRSLAREERGLKVYTVYPGGTATQMTGFRGDPPGKVADLIFDVAVGRYPLPSGSDIPIWDPMGGV
jgi:NAD(P)-dependent dehydrogenase (short-subunit alcohol dehydrogenase family)